MVVETDILKNLSLDMHQGINTVTENVEYLDNGIPILQSKNITQGYLNLEDVKYLSEISYKKYKDKYQPKVNDVLVCNIGTIGSSLRISKEENFLIAWNLFLIKLDENKLYSQYFAHYLNYLKDKKYFDKFLTGGTVKFINKKTMEKIPVPLPPLPIQKRIAEILDTADALRRKDEALLKKYDELAQAIFIDMFGDPVKNEKGWEVGTIRQLLKEAKYGTSKPAEMNGSIPYLRMNNITYNGDWDFSDLKYINLNQVEEQKYIISKGDVVFNRTNSKELVGKTAVFNIDKKMAIAGYLIRMRTNQDANPFYISGYLNSKHGKKTLHDMCKSIVGMANINAQELQDIKILLPPISLQNTFGNIYQKISDLKQKVSEEKSKSNNLFNSLLQKAFTGELVK